LQREILGRSAALVRPGGGALIYATCSLLDAENGDNARWFESQRWGHGDGDEGGGSGSGGDSEEGAEGAEGSAVGSTRFVPLPFPVGWPVEKDESSSSSSSHEVALLPHVHGTDGFYIARWTRD
jgi:16S rRNA C967 or C1407 C5-methylase (RsmB/RsmF family)